MATPSFKTIDPASILVKDEVSHDYGMLIRLGYGPSNQPVRFQTPLTRLAWDATVRDKYDPKKPSAVLSLSLDPAVQEFHNWLSDVDAHIKRMVCDNSKKWFGTKYEEGFVSGVMNNLVKLAKDEKYAPTFCPNIVLRKNPDTDVFDMSVKVFTADKKAGVPSELLKKNAEVVAVVQIAYLFINKATKAVSVRCDVDQCVVIPAPLQDDFIIDMSADPRMAAAAAAAAAAAEAAAPAAEEVNKRHFESIGGGGDYFEEGEVLKKSKIEYEEDGDDV